MIEETDFVACYNARDLILYALSVGFGSTKEYSANVDQELKYLYEQHSDFQAVPTFCLALSFWANQHLNKATSYAITPFPPPSMTATVTIPLRNLHSSDMNANLDVSAYPILHMWQSIQWYRNLPVPATSSSTIQTRMNCKITTIAPKKIGTFVTSETTIVEETLSSKSRSSKSRSPQLLCTLHSTALVLGIPKESVIPMDTSTTKSKNNKTAKASIPVPKKGQASDFQWTYETAPNQSLLYRLASGDSNRIHVLGDAMLSQKLKLGGGENSKQQPILHGLCTFGIAMRAILQYCAAAVSSNGNKQTGHSSTIATNISPSFTHLEGKFSKPVFIGDTLIVKLWNIPPRSSSKRWVIAFKVFNDTTREIAVDQGYAELRIDDTRQMLNSPIKSKL